MTKCKGCCSYNDERICAVIKHSKECPCSMCLIKMICVEVCEERIEFYLKIKGQ